MAAATPALFADAACAYSDSNRIVDAIRQAVIVVDENLRVISANRAFYRAFGVMPAETVGQHLTQVGDQRLNVPALRDFLHLVQTEGAAKDEYEIEIELPAFGIVSSPPSGFCGQGTAGPVAGGIRGCGGPVTKW